MTLSEALKIIGSLSYPSKMPCPAWGIDPKHCKTGAILRKQKGTTCSVCYACRGHYNYPAVRNAQELRLAGITHHQWVKAMELVIRSNCCSHFRWFDSGDLQSPLHLLKTTLIAIALPEVNFWLPTQEHRFIKTMTHAIPENLTIRLTNPVINPKRRLKTHLPQAEVRTDATLYDNKDAYVCPADTGPVKKCGSCRACWDKTVKTIIYRRS